MTEAWLLFDEGAIRTASGNPNGKEPLGLPRLGEAELLPDPKEALRSLLRQSCGMAGRRLRSFQPRPARIAELIDDFSPLRGLPSYRRLEAQLGAVLERLALGT
jgi:hypothetical protein